MLPIPTACFDSTAGTLMWAAILAAALIPAKQPGVEFIRFRTVLWRAWAMSHLQPPSIQLDLNQ